MARDSEVLTMNKPLLVGDGKKSFLDIQKGYVDQMLHGLKDFSKLFMKKNGGNGKGEPLSLDNIEKIYDNIVQIYYNGYRIKKFRENWIYTEDGGGGARARQPVKFESSGNLSVRIQDGAHQRMLCFTVDSKLRLYNNKNM
jgi:hypothetical protein